MKVTNHGNRDMLLEVQPRAVATHSYQTPLSTIMCFIRDTPYRSP
jgi:hypothetical protein